MNFFRKGKKNKSVENPISWKIKRECLDLIIECSKSNYPNEFGGLLRASSSSKNKIIEIVILPGTISGESHAIFKLHMLPIDFSIVGTVHSHPSPSNHPSNADLHLFRKMGKVHIIIGMPFNKTSWRAYDHNGNEVTIEIV